MDRRYYLGVVASALLAGCEGVEQPNAAPTDSAPGSTPPSTETAAPTDGQTPAETATETPDGPNEDLDSIAANVAAAVDTYLSDGGGDTLTEVRPDEFVALNGVREPLYDARRTRSDVDRIRLPPDEQARYDQLEGAYWFAWWLGLTHDALNTAYERMQSGWDAVLDEEWDTAESEWTAAGEDADEAEEFLANLRDDSDSSHMAVFDDVSPGEYDAKVDQLDAHVSDSSTLGSALVTVADGFQRYAAADGLGDYFNAEVAFTDAADALRGTNWEPTYDALVDDAVCVADAMAAGCERLYRAREADDPDVAERRREEATEEFNDCEIIEDEIAL